jgi:putative SOS response-associated peptidase YedK
MRWGLVPSWAQDPVIGNQMINARCETLDEQKPSFKQLLGSRRCLVPADGFFEWRRLAVFLIGSCNITLSFALF